MARSVRAGERHQDPFATRRRCQLGSRGPMTSIGCLAAPRANEAVQRLSTEVLALIIGLSASSAALLPSNST